MKIARRLARKAYNRLFLSLMQAVAPGVRQLNARALHACLGNHDTLHVAAPGASVSRAGRIGANGGGDVLGINYFVGCIDVPLWSDATLFVIEPHATNGAYVDALTRAVAIKGSCTVIVKGSGSPSKFGPAARLVNALAAVPGANVLVTSDAYITDLAQANYADAIVAHPRHIVSGSKTLLWALSFAFAAGYRKIVLHGFDFSVDYAYSGDSGHAGRVPQPNIWVADAARRDLVLDEVARLETLLSARGVRLMQAGCDGPLATMLPIYGQA